MITAKFHVRGKEALQPDVDRAEEQENQEEKEKDEEGRYHMITQGNKRDKRS